MAGEIFLKHNGNGGLVETVSVQAGGVGNANKIISLDATGRFALDAMPVGMGPDTKSMAAKETLADGDFVNVFSDGGTLKARKANATDATKPCHGFVLVGVSADETCLVYFEKPNTACTGMTIGAPQYLSAASAGKPTGTAPTGSGNIVQTLGVALSATECDFEPGEPITVA